MSDKISDYPAKTTIHGDDLMDFSNTEDSGVSYDVSQKLTVDEFMAYVDSNVKNIYNQDGNINVVRTLTSNGSLTRWVGGDVVVEMDDESTDYAFLVKAVGSVEVGRFGYDQPNASAELTLNNGGGEFFRANNNEMFVNTDGFFVGNNQKVGINQSSPIATVDIRSPNGTSPISYYNDKGMNGTPSSVGDLTTVGYSYNDTLGVKTGAASNIVCRVTGVGAGSVSSSLVLSGLMNITNGGVLIHPSATTQGVGAMFQVKQTAASPFNACMSLIAKGNTATQTIFQANNLAINTALKITGDLKSVFNGSQLSTGDLQHKGLTDSNLFYSDAGLDRIGIGTATAQISSKLTVTGDVETLGNTDGLIVLDRTNATRYRIYSDGGVLSIEVA